MWNGQKCLYIGASRHPYTYFTCYTKNIGTLDSCSGHCPPFVPNTISYILSLSLIHIFGGTMGALIGLPPSLVEIYGSDIRKVYQANGVPLSLGLVLTNLSAFRHLFLMSILLYLLAPVLFDAALPAQDVYKRQHLDGAVPP